MRIDLESLISVNRALEQENVFLQFVQYSATDRER